MTTTPGRVPYLDGELVIERKHIAVWSEHPEAIYQINLGGHFTVGSFIRLAAGPCPRTR
jgi:hypothetical protein